MARLGLTNLRLHLLRSFLTALGVILGVAAVITVVAVGEGSKRKALEDLEALGAKNIIIRSQRPAEGSGQQNSTSSRSFTLKYGITRLDLDILADNLPGVDAMVPLKEVGGAIYRGSKRIPSQAFGTIPEFQQVSNVRVQRGRYLTQQDLDAGSMVCVIGSEIAKDLFPLEDPLESSLRIDAKVFKVVGVLAPVGLSGGAGAALVGRDLNLDVHIPLSTARSVFGDVVYKSSSGSRSMSDIQLSEVYLAAPSREDVIPYAEVARRIMESRHTGMTDISMIVPLELLEQAKKTALTWQAVLAAIAGISLLVGGIGIMNIMLATVTERTREIGIRRALGATRTHVIWQFLIETGVLSAIGGLIGVGLGPLVSALLPRIVPLLTTHVTGWSLGVAFGVAAATGIVFGLYPAVRAARQDPIVALRHD